jgi:hypothetical protein
VAVVNLSGSRNAKNREFARLSSPLGLPNDATTALPTDWGLIFSA